MHMQYIPNVNINLTRDSTQTEQTSAKARKFPTSRRKLQKQLACSKQSGHILCHITATCTRSQNSCLQINGRRVLHSADISHLVVPVIKLTTISLHGLTTSDLESTASTFSIFWRQLKDFLFRKSSPNTDL